MSANTINLHDMHGGDYFNLETPFAAWNSISTDFITQLPESQGYTQIIVVVDQFTKMAHSIGLPTNATAKDVANVFNTRSLETSRSTHGNHIRHGCKILRRILGIPMQVARE